MSVPAAPNRRGPLERTCAQIVTGPLGHLYSVVVDLVVFSVRSLVEQARRRLCEGRSR